MPSRVLPLAWILLAIASSMAEAVDPKSEGIFRRGLMEDVSVSDTGDDSFDDSFDDDFIALGTSLQEHLEAQTGLHPPCQVCGASGQLANPDDEYVLDEEFDGGEAFNITCGEIAQYGQDGAIDIDNCEVLQVEDFLGDFSTCSCSLSLTVSPAPAMTLSDDSPSFSKDCSCENFCNAGNPDCGCYCDDVCESLGDCCSDVADHCSF